MKEGFIIPYPEDPSLDIAGKCLAWIGGSLISLGEFSTVMILDEHPVDADLFGGNHTIETQNFWIIFNSGSVHYHTVQEKGTYTFSNPMIKEPYNPQITDTGRYPYPYYPSEKCLSWEWEGDEREIEGFTVFLNDNPFKLAMPHERSVCFGPQAKCGMHMKFEVAANLPVGQSPLSVPEEYDQKSCPLQAEVQFVSIETGFTRDSYSGECDTLEAYFYIFANPRGAYRPGRFLGAGSRIPGALMKGLSERQYDMTCRMLYTFDDIGYGTLNKRDMDRIIVQIDPDKPYIYFGMHGWDYDWGSANDEINHIDHVIKDLPVDNWQGYEEEVILTDTQDDAYTKTIVRVKAYTDSSSEIFK